MNAKKCKALRQKVRAAGLDPRQAEYRLVKHPGRASQIVLGHCGRDAYRQAKSIAKTHR